jgi:hypothetical protein
MRTTCWVVQRSPGRAGRGRRPETHANATAAAASGTSTTVACTIKGGRAAHRWSGNPSVTFRRRPAPLSGPAVHDRRGCWELPEPLLHRDRAAGRMGGVTTPGRVPPGPPRPAGRRSADPARCLGRAAPARRARPLPARAQPAARRARPGARGQPRSRRRRSELNDMAVAREHLGPRVGVPVVLPGAHPAPLDGGRRGLPAPGLPGPRAARRGRPARPGAPRDPRPARVGRRRPGRSGQRSRTTCRPWRPRSTPSPRRCSRTSPTRSASWSGR